MRFTVNETGKTYDYVFHKSMVNTPAQHLQMYFAPTCSPPETMGVNPIDLDGIRRGQAIVGMTKQGVVLAMGYPPPHATPSLEGDAWIYWKSTMNRVRIVFVDGFVSAIED